MRVLKKIIPRVLMALLICAIILPLSLSNQASTPIVEKIIKIAGDKSFPPYEFIEGNGIYRGFNVDIMNAVAVETGVHFEIIPMEWKDALDALEKGEVDAIQGMTKSDEREKIYSFTEEILINSQVIFVPKAFETISDKNDLSGHVVVVQKGDISYEAIKNIANIQIVFADNQIDAMKLLLEGKVDAFVGNRLVGRYNIQKLRASNKVKIVGTAIRESEYGPAVIKGNTEVLQVFDRGIKKIKDNGTYEKIYYKWFGESFYDVERIYGKYIIIPIGIVVFLSIIIFVYVWINRKLKKGIEERTAAIEAAKRELEEVNKHLLNEIRERKKVEDLVWHQAHYDYLTDLPNRRLFIKKLIDAIDRASTEKALLAVLFLDLDDFKNINDNYGHQSGDELLVKFSEKLLEYCGPNTVVSRFGGDEFTILLEDISDVAEVYSFVEKLNKSFEKSLKVNGIDIKLYASIGVSIYPENGRDADELLNKADNMMYITKQNNKQARA